MRKGRIASKSGSEENVSDSHQCTCSSGNNDYFCKQCRRVICTFCTSTIHKHHECEPVGKVSRDIQNGIREYGPGQKKKEKMESVQRVQQMINSIKIDLIALETKKIGEIDEKLNDLHNELKKIRSVLVRKIQESVRKDTEYLNEAERILSNTAKSITSMCDAAKKLVDEQNSLSVINDGYSICADIEEVMKIKVEMPERRDAFSLEFYPGTTDDVGLQAMFGKISMKSRKKKPDGSDIKKLAVLTVCQIVVEGQDADCKENAHELQNYDGDLFIAIVPANCFLTVKWIHSCIDPQLIKFDIESKPTGVRAGYFQGWIDIDNDPGQYMGLLIKTNIPCSVRLDGLYSYFSGFLFPARLLGFEYFVVFPMLDLPYYQFGVVSSNNDTYIQIDIKRPTNEYNETISLRMNVLETYIVTRFYDISGTRIRADHIIVAYSWMKAFNDDTTILSLPPVKTLGRQFNALAHTENLVEVRIVTTAKSTSFSGLHGREYNKCMVQGRVTDLETTFEWGQDIIFITADGPLLVLQTFPDKRLSTECEFFTMQIL